MPPSLLVDLAQIDLDQVILTREQIYEKYLPQRHEFMLLDGVCALDAKQGTFVAYADIREDAWWVSGHIPGRPLLPGVLMLELAAQTSAIAATMLMGDIGFIGFGGVDKCKFRDSVVPPARLHLLCVATDLRPRRIISQTQGVVGDRLIFEAQITGLIMR